MPSKNDNSESSFNHLVAEISPAERKILLDKIKNVSGVIETQTLENPFAQYDDVNISISEDFKNEFFLYKFWIWLRSFFKGMKPEDLYANDRIIKLAAEINQFVPGIIDINHGYLTTLFYDHINQLKNCADFFKPYLAKIQENTGSFYVFLGSIVLPELTALLNEDADPFSTPPTPTVTKEHRAALLRRIDDTLKNIPPISRNNLYKAVVSIEWLRQFVSLPFTDFLSLFVNLVSDSYVCSFDRAGNSFVDFVTVLAAGKTVTAEALEALFLFDCDKSERDKFDEFLHTAGTYLKILHGFISAVPIVSVARIVFNDYTWQAPSFGGAEDWFVKYKAEWKNKFDARWEKWVCECKKEGQREILKTKFSLDSFPLMPYRPWSEIWGGLHFNCELTGGFICWYLEKRLPENTRLLRFLQLEGDFSKPENKESLTSALNGLNQVDSSAKDLLKSLKIDGDIGSIFDRLANDHMRTLRAQQKIDSLIAVSGQTVRDMKMKFCNSLRQIIQILKGVFNESDNDEFGSIRNLNSISGPKNKNYVSDLHSLIQSFTDIVDIISGIEMIENESPKTQKK